MGRRIVRVCSDRRRTSQEIADALGTTVGGIQHTLTALLREGLLHTDGADHVDGEPRPTRGAQFWADEEQLVAAQKAANGAHDPGRVIEGELLVLVHGPDVAAMRDVLAPALTEVTTRWIARLGGEDALWLLAIGPDRDPLLADQLAASAREAGGTVQVLSVERLLDLRGLRAYLRAVESASSVTPGRPARR